MRYTTVLLDADGTLLDFERSEAEAVWQTMEQNGISPTPALVKRYSEINDGLWKMLERGEIEKSVLLYHRFELFADEFGYQIDAKKMAEDYMNNLSQKGYLLDGAKELLVRLQGKADLYIVTNGVEFIQTERHARSGLRELIKEIFISGRIGFEKPDVRYFEAVAAAIPNFDPTRTLVVGDSLTSDMQGGINAGLDVCWFNPKGKAAPDHMPLTFVASNYDEIYNLIVSGEE